MASASDIPHRFDCVINGQGYLYPDSLDTEAAFGTTPTFVDRTNVSGSFVDNTQDFWLTFRQNDWSGGEQQKYQDDEQPNHYWSGQNVNVDVAGEVTVRFEANAATFAAAIRAIASGGGLVNSHVYAASTANLYRIDSSGAITSEGAHGLGTTPSRFGMTNTGDGIYISTSSVGTVGVRRWNGAYSTFSATGSDSLAYLNNALYGYSTGVLRRYDTAGVATTLYTWQGATTTVNTPSKLLAFGSKLLILRTQTGLPVGGELWLYDGTAPAKIAEFPANFAPYDCAVYGGTVFVSGCFLQISGGGSDISRPAIYYYANGTQDVLWKADQTITNTYTNVAPALCIFDQGVVWNDDSRGQFTYYHATTGSTSSIGAYTVAGSEPLLASSPYHFLHSRNQTTAYYYPSRSLPTQRGFLDSSLLDFNSSLSKLFRGVAVEFESGEIDVYYQMDTHGGSWTNLVFDAVSGTEYNLPSATSGKAITVRLDLNPNGLANNCHVKRLAVRAAPVQRTFKREQYFLSLIGRDTSQLLKLRDGSFHTLDGKAMADNLWTAIRSAVPITISDEFGTYTGIAEADKCQLQRIRTEEYLGSVVFREV